MLHAQLAATTAQLPMEHKFAQAAQLIMDFQTEHALYAQLDRHHSVESAIVQSVVWAALIAQLLTEHRFVFLATTNTVSPTVPARHAPRDKPLLEEIVTVLHATLAVKTVLLQMELKSAPLAMLTSHLPIALVLPVLVANMLTREPLNAPTAQLAAPTALEPTQQQIQQVPMLVAQHACLTMDLPTILVLPAQRDNFQLEESQYAQAAQLTAPPAPTTMLPTPPPTQLVLLALMAMVSPMGLVFNACLGNIPLLEELRNA